MCPACGSSAIFDATSRIAREWRGLHCTRTACRAPLAWDGVHRHADTGEPYCIDCAAKINRACPERPGLVTYETPTDLAVLSHCRTNAVALVANGGQPGRVMAYVLSSAWSAFPTTRCDAHGVWRQRGECACSKPLAVSGEILGR